MKNHVSICIWILLLCETGATEPLETSLERLRTIARVTNGAYLTRELIKGVDKTVLDGILVELLMIGGVTPEELGKVENEELAAAILRMKNLKKELKSSDDVKIVEKNWRAMIELHEGVKIIQNFTNWLEKDDFQEAALSWKNGVNTSVIEKLREQIKDLKEQFETTDKGSSIGRYRIQMLAEPLIDMIAALKSDHLKFSEKGSATKLSEIPVKISDNLNIANKIDTSFPNALDDAEINAKKFFGVMGKGKNLAASFETLTRFIEAVSQFGASRRLQYTSGLPDGYPDLLALQDDVRSEWISEKVGNGEFWKAFRALKRVEKPLGEFFAKFETNRKFSCQKASDEAKILSDMESDSENVKALEMLKLCPARGASNYDLTSINTIRDMAMLIDRDFSAAKVIIDSAISKFDEEDVKEKLKSLVELCENPTATTDQFAEYSSLITTLNDISLEVNTSAIRFYTRKALGVIDDIDPFLQIGLEGYTELFKCVSGLNAPLVTPALDLISNYREKPIEFIREMVEAANAAIGITGIDRDIPKVRGAMLEVNGREYEHSKLLVMLENPKKTSDTIGKAVQAVVQMHEVHKKAMEIDTVIMKLEAIEIPDSFDQKELLNELIGLNASFVAMKSSLATWHSAVKDKEVRALSDAKSIFEPSKDVTGVKGDLDSKIAALERLIEQVPPKLQDLRALHFSLREVESFNLDFGSYAEPLASVGGALDGLEQFFADIRNLKPATTRMTSTRFASTEPSIRTTSESGNGAQQKLRRVSDSETRTSGVGGEDEEDYELGPNTIHFLMVTTLSTLFFVIGSILCGLVIWLRSNKYREIMRLQAAPASPGKLEDPKEPSRESESKDTTQTQPSDTPKLAPSPTTPKIAQKMSNEQSESKKQSEHSSQLIRYLSKNMMALQNAPSCSKCFKNFIEVQNIQKMIFGTAHFL